MNDAAILFDLFVPGVPQPAGSKKAIPVWNRRTGTYASRPDGRPIIAVVDDAKGSREWKDRVSAHAFGHWTGGLLEEPLALFVVFTMPRIRAHFGSRGGERYLKPGAPHFHTGPPDATKLVRAVEDALNGVVWKDDRFVVEQHVRKLYGDVTGAAIRIARATPLPIPQPT